MALILKASSPPGAFSPPDIPLQAGPVSFGRDEPGLSAWPAEVAQQLSPRHAKIMRFETLYYLVDMQSERGTTLNGEPVRKPMRLKHGDQICFAGQIRYRVLKAGHSEPAANEALAEPAAPAAARTPPAAAAASARTVAATVPDAIAPLPVKSAPPTERLAPVCLRLVPEQTGAGLAPIDIRTLPLALGKDEPALVDSAGAERERLSHVSRRHARLERRGTAIYLEDLGSTNGTFLNGERLHLRSAQLAAGDRVCLGGEPFLYRVELGEGIAGRSSAPTDLLPRPPTTVRMTQRTTGLGTEPATRIQPATATVAAAPTVIAAAARPPLRLPGDGRWRAATVAWVRSPGKPALYAGLGLVALLLAGTTGVGLYQRFGIEHRLAAYIARGDYSPALIEADAYLTEQPGADGVQALAGEALAQSIVPTLQALLAARSLEDAAQQVAAVRPVITHSAQARQVLDALDWIVALEHAVAVRGGLTRPMQLYRDELAMQRLLARWDAAPAQWEQALDLIVRAVPEFESLARYARATLASLKAEQQAYGTAIAAFKTDLESLLARDRADAIQPLLEGFAALHPRLQISNLLYDLERYLPVERALHALDPQALAATGAGLELDTPPFRHKLAGLLKDLPRGPLAAEFRSAGADWRAGDTVRGLAKLAHLADEPWGVHAGRILSERQRLVERYAQLKSMHGAADYDARLLAFYRELDPIEDVHFLHAIDSDLRGALARSIAQAERDFDLAQTHWDEYLAAGRISPALRGSDGPQSAFRRQAERLDQAYALASRALLQFQNLKKPVPDALDRLFRAVTAEAQAQKQALRESATRLPQPALDARLVLLPTP